MALEILIDDEIIGKNKENLNHNIGLLVKERRIPSQIQRAMDTLRITGDAALHPGLIDLKNIDNHQTARSMFDLLNLITEVLITDPRKINEYFNTLPQSQRDSIEKKRQSRIESQP